MHPTDNAAESIFTKREQDKPEEGEKQAVYIKILALMKMRPTIETRGEDEQSFLYVLYRGISNREFLKGIQQ